MTLTSIVTNIKRYEKEIAADVIAVGGIVTAALASVSAFTSTVHVPAADVAIVASASALVTGIVNQARRVAASKSVVPASVLQPIKVDTTALQAHITATADAVVKQITDAQRAAAPVIADVTAAAKPVAKKAAATKATTTTVK